MQIVALISAFVAWALFLPPASADQGTPKILKDEDLIRYEATTFNARDVMNKTITLGIHNGVRVIVEHPCSDLCPQYTTRIIRYDIENERCEVGDGKLAFRRRPLGIATPVVQYCVPKVLAKE